MHLFAFVGMWFFAGYWNVDSIAVWLAPDELFQEEGKSPFIPGMYTFKDKINYELFGPPQQFSPMIFRCIPPLSPKTPLTQVFNIASNLFIDILTLQKIDKQYYCLFYEPKYQHCFLTQRLKCEIEFEFWKQTSNFWKCVEQSKAMILIARIDPETTGVCLKFYCDELSCANYYPCSKHNQ